ncbi:MAG: glycosyltransferase [Flavobacteriales bacterium]|nr:glycosyltransferase [Flavobacteriales bacterium]
MNQRILILCSHFPPVNATGARRPYYLARALQAHGHPVTVLTNQLTADPPWVADMEGLTVFRLPLTDLPEDLPGWQRVASQLLRPWRGTFLHRPMQALLEPLLPLFHGRRWGMAEQDILRRIGPQDIVVATGPDWYMFEMGMRLAQGTGATFFTDHRDPWNTLIPGVSLQCLNWYGRGIPSWIRRRRNLALERQILQRTAGMTAASPAYLDNAKAIAGDAPGIVIYNGILRRTPPGHVRNERFTILYTGRTYVEQDWKLVVDALLRSSPTGTGPANDIVLRVRGVGGDIGGIPKVLRECAARTGLVELMPELDRDALAREAGHADLLLSVVCEGNRGQLPLKLVDYLSYGRPILLTGGTRGIQHEVLERTRTGVAIGDTGALTTHLIGALDAWRAGTSPSYAPDTAALEALSITHQMDRWRNFLLEHSR